MEHIGLIRFPRNLISATLLAALSPGVIHADEFTDFSIEEIVVTAQKREQSLTDVAGSLQAFTGDNLENLGVTGLEDIAGMIPSASFVNAPAAGWQTMQIRGISSGTTGEATTGYYIDELAFGVPNLQVAPPARFFDLERIEVLRGPQGTLYGQGSMGGTVKIITADANPNEFQAKFQTGIASASGADLSYYADFSVNLPLIEDKLGLRVSGGMDKTSGYGKSPDFPDEDKLGDSDSSNVRVKLNFTPNDELSIEATLWHMESNQDFSSFVDAKGELYPALDQATAATLAPIAGAADLAVILDPVTFAVVGPNPDPMAGGTFYQDAYSDYLQARSESHNELDSGLDMASVQVDWDLGFATLVSGTSYMDHQLPWTLEFAGGLSDITALYETESVTQELRLVSNGDSNLNWLVGVFISEAEFESETLTTLPNLGPVYGPLIGGLTGDTLVKGKADISTRSVFGEVSAMLFDGVLEPSLGLRYFEDERTFTGISEGGSSSGTSNSLNPRLAVKWNLAEEGMVYASAAKGFRSGSVQGTDSVAGAAAMGINTETLLDEDSLWSFELGSKWTLLDGSLVLDAALYHSQWDDVQLQFSTATVVANANAGDAEITGFDLGAMYATPVKGLTLQLAANINRSEWTSVDPVIAAVLPGVEKGGELANAPQRSATFSLDYQTQVFSELEGFARFSWSHLRPQMEVTSGSTTEEMNDLSLRLGVKAGDWEFTLFGENLLDQDGPIGLTNYTPAPEQRLYPRKLGLNIKFQM
jgi:outer membrane receptor protein involved in Fe transport